MPKRTRNVKLEKTVLWLTDAEYKYMDPPWLRSSAAITAWAASSSLWAGGIEALVSWTSYGEALALRARCQQRTPEWSCHWRTYRPWQCCWPPWSAICLGPGGGAKVGVGGVNTIHVSMPHLPLHSHYHNIMHSFQHWPPVVAASEPSHSRKAMLHLIHSTSAGKHATDEGLIAHIDLSAMWVLISEATTVIHSNTWLLNV